MLQIKNLSKSYGAKKAVSNLSFVVEDGDIMGFIGKNGAGKTTTLKACLGIIGIDEGEILLDGTSGPAHVGQSECYDGQNNANCTCQKQGSFIFGVHLYPPEIA